MSAPLPHLAIPSPPGQPHQAEESIPMHPFVTSPSPSMPFPTPANGASPSYFKSDEYQSMDPLGEQAQAQRDNRQPDTQEIWKHVMSTMKKYDDKMVGGWKDELNNLLIFAGLFSAIVTAFNIESYQWLESNPEDQTVELLQQILKQMSSSSSNNTNIASAVSFAAAKPYGLEPFSTESTDVAINVLWFLSLTLALSAALFAILLQQWIRQYEDMPLVDDSERARIRHKRFLALDHWFVPKCVMSLSVLLQAALFAFFSGLLLLLWDLNHTVAIVVSSAVGVFLVICALTTVLPVFFASCPYLSPLSLAFRFLVWATAWIITAPLTIMLHPLWEVLRTGRSRLPPYGKSPNTWDRFSDKLFHWITALQTYHTHVHKHVSCRTWLAVEKLHGRQAIDDPVLVRNAMRWTSKTSSAMPMDVLAFSVLEPTNSSPDPDPMDAALEWFAEATGIPRERLEATLAGREDAPEKRRRRRAIPGHHERELEAVVGLIRHTCRCALDPESPRKVRDEQRKSLRDMALWAVDRRIKEPLDDCWMYLISEAASMGIHYSWIIIVCIVPELLLRVQSDNEPDKLAIDCLTRIVESQCYRQIHYAMDFGEVTQDGITLDRGKLTEAYELLAMASLELGYADIFDRYSHSHLSRRSEIILFLREGYRLQEKFIHSWFRTFERMLTSAKDSSEPQAQRLAMSVIHGYFTSIMKGLGLGTIANALNSRGALRTDPANGKNQALRYPLLSESMISRLEQERANPASS